jgi:hypothetical protein
VVEHRIGKDDQASIIKGINDDLTDSLNNAR